MSELTEVETALSKIAQGGVKEFSINGERATTLDLKELRAYKNELKDEALDALEDGTGRGTTGAYFCE